MALTAAKRVESPFHPRGSGEPEAAADTRADQPSDLTLREMTGFEEEYIEAHIDDTNTARIVNEVLARCLVPPGADHCAALQRVRGLLVADRDVALIQLRRRSLGDAVHSEVDCPACGAITAASFNLSDLPTHFPRPPDRLSVHLPDGRMIEVRLPTAGDQEALLDAGVEGRAERITWLIARLIERLDGSEAPLDTTTARTLTAAARAAIDAALTAAVPDLDLSMHVVCSACRHDFTAPFDVISFFLPR